MPVLDLIITIFGILFTMSFISGFSYLILIREPFPNLRVTDNWNHYPKVTIILPVRNEAKRIIPALESLRKLEYPDLEIIVVDGSSDDDTKAIASRYNFTVIDEGKLPNGWIGKVWGCWVGAEQATGDILLFTDADVKHRTDSLKLCVNHMLSNNIDALTLLTNQEAKSFWERTMSVVLFMIFIASGGARKTRDPNSPISVANGQYFIFRRDCYFSIGGHKTVYNNIVEDVALAFELKKHGKKFEVISEPSIASTRMYQGGLPEMWEGWTKNMYRGALLFGPVQQLAALTILLWGLGAPLIIISGFTINTLPVIALGLIGYLTLVITLNTFSRMIGEYPWYYSIIYPVGMTFFVFAFVYSCMRDMTGMGAVWRGRVYKKR